jgi:hypothetical protein
MNRLLLASALGISSVSFALEPMSDTELSASTGEGIGIVVDDLAIYSGDYGQSDDFVIKLELSETPGHEQFLLSEFRLNKTGTTPGSASSGGSFGTVNNPVFMGDLRSVEVFSGDVSLDADERRTVTTVMRSEFPGANISQLDRRSSEQAKANYQARADNFEAQLDQVSDKFSLHWRFDDVIDGNESFRGLVDIDGFRFYGTSTDLFATADKGFSLAGTTGIYIDQVRISGDQSGVVSSQIALNGMDIFSTLGTVDQPLTVRSVKDIHGNNQLQLEIAALPASIGVAPKSDIYIKSLYFGDQYNPDMRTGLRTGQRVDGSTIDGTQNTDYHYAFQPDVGNTIEIVGMSIQHLRITTMEL